MAEDTSFDFSYYQESTPYQKRVHSVEQATHRPSVKFESNSRFATPGRLSSTSNYINSQLIAHGFPGPLKLCDGDKEDASRVVDSLFALLQAHERHLEEKEELSDSLRRTELENENLQNSLTKAKARIELSEREVDGLKGKLCAVEETLKSEMSKHKFTRAECQAAKSDLLHIKTQYSHELRKREQEHTRLKERMQKVLNDKMRAFKITAELVNPAPKSLLSGSRIGANTDEDIHQNIIRNYEERERNFVTENQKLREGLFDAFQGIEVLLKGEAARDGRIINTKFRPTENLEDPARLDLPYDMIIPFVENDIKNLIALLKQEWENRSRAEPDVDPQVIKERDIEIERLMEEVYALKQQLAQNQYEAEEKGKIIEHFMSGNFFEKTSNPADISAMELTAPELDEEMEMLKMERRQIEEERRKLSEAAIKIGKERISLKAERAAFAEEQRVERTKAMLDLFPPTPEWLKSSRPPTQTALKSAMKGRNIKESQGTDSGLIEEQLHKTDRRREVRIIEDGVKVDNLNPKRQSNANERSSRVSKQPRLAEKKLSSANFQNEAATATISLPEGRGVLYERLRKAAASGSPLVSESSKENTRLDVLPLFDNEMDFPNKREPRTEKPSFSTSSSTRAIGLQPLNSIIQNTNVERRTLREQREKLEKISTKMGRSLVGESAKTRNLKSVMQKEN